MYYPMNYQLQHLSLDCYFHTHKGVGILPPNGTLMTNLFRPLITLVNFRSLYQISSNMHSQPQTTI